MRRQTHPKAFPVHDLPDLGVSLASESGDYTTVAGLILTHTGRVPELPGDQVQVDGWVFEVVAVAHHAITRVRLSPLPTDGFAETACETA